MLYEAAHSFCLRIVLPDATYLTMGFWPFHDTKTGINAKMTSETAPLLLYENMLITENKRFKADRWLYAAH